MKILITGSKGAIGSYLTPYLKKECEVIEIISDITDYSDLKNKIEKYKDADWIINLAALVNTITCDVADRYSFDVNVKGAYNVAMLSKKFKMKHCYFSTTAIYKPNILIKEESEKDPQTLYGFTKYLGEMSVNFVYKDQKEDLLIIRPCFIFGGKNDHSIGSLIVKSALKQVPLVILLDPENKKDYMHISNFSEAIYKLIKKEANGDYNISYGKPIKFKELVDKVKKMGLKPIIYYRSEEDYMKNHCVDNSKLKNEIKWNPTITLDEGLKEVFKNITKKHE